MPELRKWRQPDEEDKAFCAVYGDHNSTTTNKFKE